jgi:hypothetical protein
MEAICDGEPIEHDTDIVGETGDDNSYISNTYENLYNSLSYNLLEEDLSTEQKNDLVTLSSKLDLERKEIIYHLCLIDYCKYSPNTKVVFPYKCKQTTTDTLEFKVDNLPIRLKQILLRFVRVADMSMGQG